MNLLTLILVMIMCTLALLSAGMSLIILFLRHKNQLTQKNSSKKMSLLSSVTDDIPIVRYSEYKKRYGSRSRDIAVIAGKNSTTTAIAEEFVESMREYGSLLYHFTHYWHEDGNLRSTQKEVDRLLAGRYDAIMSAGTQVTRALKYASIHQNKLIPIVFAGLRDTWWEKEQSLREVTHMTGITGSSGWEKRIRIFCEIKPEIRSVAIPVAQSFLAVDMDGLKDIFNRMGIHAELLRVHNADELLKVIGSLPPSFDTVLSLQDGMISTLADKVATICNEKKITYFSPFASDVARGAAAAVSMTPTVNIGKLAAQKMMSILEDYKRPCDVPLYNIDADVVYEVHFNQEAMKQQGLSPSLIAPLALKHHATVRITSSLGI